MPRQRRFIFNKAFYHIFNRGINKQSIFLAPEDFHFFLKKLEKVKEKYDFSLYALCIMPNHFHLSIQTKKDPISKIMSSIATSYSMYFNRTYNHYGPVFQNRYKSILVENDSYFLKLSQYIYLNPVKAGLVKDPILYQYSSIREALGEEPPRFLDKDITRLVGDNHKARNSYKNFLYSGIEEDLSEIEQLFEKEEAVLGSNRFSTLAQKKHLRRRSKNYV